MPKPEPVKYKIMLDSGAFSAWFFGLSLDIKDYTAFVKKHQHLLDSYVNMDVIPGPGIDCNKAAELSFKNYQYMKDAGLHPIPVFHRGEHVDWLEKLLAAGERYIGIGGIAPIKPEVRRVWLDQIFSMLCDSDGKPLVKTHGFGVTDFAVLKRYPWFSVDSTAWSIAAGHGFLPVPQWGKGGWAFDKRPHVISLSNMAGEGTRNQFDDLSEQEKETVRAWLNYCKLHITETRYDHRKREIAWLIYYRGLEDTIKDVRFTGGSGGFHQPITLPKGLKGQSWNLSIVHSVKFKVREFHATLNEMDVRHRLISYYELREFEDGTLEEYVDKGIWGGEYEPTRMKPNWNSGTYIKRRRLAMKERFHNDADQ